MSSRKSTTNGGRGRAATTGKGKNAKGSAAKGKNAKSKTQAKGKAKTKAKSNASPKLAGWDMSWDGDVATRLAKWMGGVVGGLGLVLFWVVARKHLMHYADQAYPTQADALAVVLVDVNQPELAEADRPVDANGDPIEPTAPRWMGESIAYPIRDHVAATITARRFDAQGLAAAAQAAAAEPWIKSVQQVHRDDQGRLVIEAEFRVPVAVVRDQTDPDFVYCVDDEGVVLAGPWHEQDLLRQQREAGRQHLFVVTGLTGRPPVLGEVWQGENIRAALDLVVLIKDMHQVEEIAAIDVTPGFDAVDEEGEMFHVPTLTLITPDSQVLWGYAPGPKAGPEAQGVEYVSTQTKLGHLHRMLSRRGGLAAYGDARIDGRTIVRENGSI